MDVHVVKTPHRNSVNNFQLNRSNLELATVQPKHPLWLRLITIFWNPKVLKTALKFGIVATIMNRYERIGFVLLMLCIIL